MKKTWGYLLALTLLTPLSAVAQRTNVRAADRLLQSEKPNYTEIRRLLKLATEHEETKQDPYTYYIQGLVEHQLYHNEYRKIITPGTDGDTTKMFRLLIAELSPWQQANTLERQPDASGRVVLKYLRKIQEYLKDDAPKMYEAGLFWLDRKQYTEASQAFSSALTAHQILLPIGKTKLETDTTAANLAYYALVAAYTGKLYPQVIELGKRYRDLATNKNEVYQMIARAHLAERDTVGAMPLLEEGARLFPRRRSTSDR